MPTAIVAGGGIAGLASALALTQQGWRVTVLERAAVLGEVGAGVALARNGVASLQALGFDDGAIASIGTLTRAGGTFDRQGRPILALSEDVDGVTMRGVHRARLHGALLERVQERGVDLITGAQVTSPVPGVPGGAQAEVTADGITYRADLLVAADGVNSAVRAALAPVPQPVYSGYSSWRAVLDHTLDPPVLTQYWGPHAEFGTMPIDDDRTYWYGYVKMPQGTLLLDEHLAASERFADWASPVRQIIAATPPGAVMRHDVFHLPGGMARYHHGRVVAVGDAAHAMLPTMGQGVATALEDGICVGKLVGEPVAAGRDLAAALADYDAARRPRCRTIARSALASAIAGSHLGPGLQGVRNALMRLTPRSAISRGADAVMGWTPPV